LSETPTIITTGIQDGSEMIQRMRTSQLLKAPEVRLAPLKQRFDLCLIQLTEADIQMAGEVAERVELLMRDGGKVIVAVIPRRYTGNLEKLNDNFTAQLARLMRPSVRSIRFECVPANPLRRIAHTGLGGLVSMARNAGFAGLTFGAVASSPLLIMAWAGNWLTRVRRGQVPSQPISSAFVTLVIDSERAMESHQFSGIAAATAARRDTGKRVDTPVAFAAPIGGRAIEPALTRDDSGSCLSGRCEVGQTVDAPLTVESEPALVETIQRVPQTTGETDMPPNDGAETREPQYNRCLDLQARQGLTSLGLMTNQVWEDDPRRLVILLSRYKFVAKMLSGRKFVGELGCGDAFGTRIVLQEVERVVAYDFDPLFVADIRSRPSARWPIEAREHDILTGKLPYEHDAIYSLDVIEHIRSADEDKYLRNLSDSLTPSGVLIIGSPTLESQAHASPPSKVGHINCKSGGEMKALLEHYFENVFLFSMNDEVVHTGFYPMAHYLFAICCQKKPA
jgi:SAM-dependent methyltransferase